MKKFNPARIAVAAAIFGMTAVPVMFPSPAMADDTPTANAPVDVLRPAIINAITSAKALYDAKNTPDALAKLAETDSIHDKTAYETFAVERTRGEYYLNSGDFVNAAKSFEVALSSNYLQKKSDQLELTKVIGRLYNNAHDYPNTILWLERYQAQGGTDPVIKEIVYQAYFFNKDYAPAYKGLNQYVQDELAAGRVPEAGYFKMLVQCEDALGDKPGTTKALEQLNTFYPTLKNWDYLVSQIRFQPNFSDHLFLDLYRLKLELTLMKSAGEYSDMAELATRAGLPAEAKKVLDQGFAAGLLDKGPDAKKNAAARDAAAKRAEEDLKTMQQGEAGAAKGKDGGPLVNLGMAFATAGQFDKGASLIEQGIAKGLPARAEEAKLHLGLVYYWAGRKEDAVKTLQTVQGTDGISTLARYWIMQINRPVTK